MGTWGPGAFDNDDALDLLDTLAEQDAAQRRQTLEQILCRPPDSLDDVSWLEGCGEIIAAAAVVAAGLPSGDAITQAVAGLGYDAAAIVIRANPVLADDALAALLVVTGHDHRAGHGGAWHHGWPDEATALQARRTTDDLASAFRRYRHRHDQQLPLEW